MRARKGTNKALAKTHNPKPELPAIVQEGTKAYDVAQKLIGGHSLADIAKEYEQSEENLKRLVTGALTRLAEDTSVILLNWVNLALSRHEIVAKGLFPKLFDDDGNPNETAIKLYQDTLEQERRIVQMLASAGRNGDDASKFVLQFNQTIIGGSKLYAMGAIALQEKYRDGTVEREDDADLRALDDVILGGISTYPDGRANSEEQSLADAHADGRALLDRAGATQPG